MLPSNEELIARLRSWNNDYVERSPKRIDATGEIFTPTELVQDMLDQIPHENFSDPSKTFLDPSCGNGQFLSEVLICKLSNDIDLKTALKAIYGVDIMYDNVEVCRERLLCGVEQYRYIVERNIVCADALEFNFKFPDWDDD